MWLQAQDSTGLGSWSSQGWIGSQTRRLLSCERRHCCFPSPWRWVQCAPQNTASRSARQSPQVPPWSCVARGRLPSLVWDTRNSSHAELASSWCAVSTASRPFLLGLSETGILRLWSLAQQPPHRLPLGSHQDGHSDRVTRGLVGVSALRTQTESPEPGPAPVRLIQQAWEEPERLMPRARGPHSETTGPRLAAPQEKLWSCRRHR